MSENHPSGSTATDALFAPYAGLLEAEQTLHPDIELDRTLRVKLLDMCGMTCNFCHNEGTPVASSKGFQAHRVSIYEQTNGISFTQADITSADAGSFTNALERLRDADIADEVHWTGGEPTLSKSIVHLTGLAIDAGYTAKMTSNGQSGERGLRELAEAGLGGINFSIFGTTAEELAATQGPVFQNNLKLADLRLKKMSEALIAACELELNVKANIVILGEHDIDRGLRLLKDTPEQVKVRFQADTSNRVPSSAAIYHLMDELDAVPVARTMVAGSSIDNYDYQLPGGRIVTFKQTRFSRLPSVCEDCPIDTAGQCFEGYYGLRLYKDIADTYWLSPCLQRMDTAQTLDAFLSPNGLGRSLEAYRAQEHARLQRQFVAV